MSKYRIFVFVSLLTLSLVFLSIGVSNNSFKQFDFSITKKVQTLVPRKLDSFMSAFSILGTFEITTAILLVLILKFKKLNWFWILAFYAAGEVFELLGKLFIKHPGPPKMFFRYDLGFIFPSADLKTAYSFPSGHVFRTTFIILTLSMLIFYSQKISKTKKIILGLFLLGFLTVMMISRIYLGEHWASDVVAGLLLGMILAFCYNVIINHEG